MNHDLDIVKLIQRNQIYDVNEQVLYNQRERFLLQFQRRKVICSESDSSVENAEFAKMKHDWDIPKRGDNSVGERKDFEKLVHQYLKEVEKKDQCEKSRRILLGIAT